MTATLQSIRDQIAANQAVRAGATKGPWRVPRPWTKLVDGADVECIVQAESAADAAAIVADHDSAPRCEAAVLAVLELHVVHHCSCGGRRWSDDENWSPDHRLGRVERTEGDGLIPCGFCNHGGWNVDQYAPGSDSCEECDAEWPCSTVATVVAAWEGAGR